MKIKHQRSKIKVGAWKFGFWICFGFWILILGFGIVGCGQQETATATTTTSTTTTTVIYAISGKVGTISSQGITAASALSVTHIVAINSNNTKYVATPESNGTFSLNVVNGWPYAVGFYNQTGSAITLLGYLRQSQVDWDSLPLMNPADTATDLGTVEIDTAILEATPSIGLDDLLSEVNMGTAAANLYGRVDDMMTVFTNVDVDGNGQFDFAENKSYTFRVIIGINLSGSLSSGEVTKMLSDYNDDYYPTPTSYQFILYAQEGVGGADTPPEDTAVTIRFPEVLYNSDGTARITNTGSTAIAAGGYGWSASCSQTSGAGMYSTPEVVPSGTYTLEVTGRANYTFNNVKGSPIVAIGTTEGIVYPVFHLATNEAGLLTTVNYKWQIRENGEIREATAAEVAAVVRANSPSISIYTEYPSTPTSPYYSPKDIDIDGSSLDVSDWNVQGADIEMFSTSYYLNSNISVSHLFMK